MEFKEALTEGHPRRLTISEGDVSAHSSSGTLEHAIIIFHLLEYTLSHME